MKTTMLSFAAITSLLNLGSGFVITGCDSGTVTNFGDDKCQIWTDNNFTFESDAGCTLYAYSEGNCQGSIFQTATQNECQVAPDGVVSINCKL